MRLTKHKPLDINHLDKLDTIQIISIYRDVKNKEKSVELLLLLLLLFLGEHKRQKLLNYC